MTNKLTIKQLKFVNEYLIDGNATRAAKTAGYSYKTAYRTGADNLKKPQISAAIEKAVAKQAERTKVTADKVIAEYAKVGFSNVQDFHDSNGAPKAIHELSRDDAAAIKNFEIGKDGLKVTLHDKQKALDSLSKHLGLFAHDDEGRDLEPPSLKVFIQGNDGIIQPVSDEIPKYEKVPGVLIQYQGAAIEQNKD